MACMSRALPLLLALLVPAAALALQADGHGDLKPDKASLKRRGHKEAGKAKGGKQAAKAKAAKAAKAHAHGAHAGGQKAAAKGHGHHEGQANRSAKKDDHEGVAKSRKERIEKLRKDELFMPTELHAGKAKTVSEDCDSWIGEGLHCETEFPEHALVRDWIPSNAVVMEFGARFGTTSCEIARKLNNSGNVIVVEPDLNVWEDLEGNLKSHNCNAHMLRGAVSSVDLHMSPKLNVKRGYSTRALQKGGVTVPGYSFHEVESALGKKVDTLLIDCEGCAQDMMDQLSPVIESGQIKLLIIEGDMPIGAKDCHSHCMDYDKFFMHLRKHGFTLVDKFNDCDRTRTGAPKGKWCGSWIDHFAFQRK